MSDIGAPPEPEPESSLVYLRFRQIFGDGTSRSRDSRKRSQREPGSTVPYGLGRDPHGLSAVMDSLTARMGWNSSLARSEILSSWSEIAGQETAEHSEPVGIEEGVMTVRCDSTAWATQLRLMKTPLLTQIIVRYPDAGIDSLRFEGPNAPSWKRGLRSIPGRGPRDTYG